jgi:hypothetical protein
VAAVAACGTALVTGFLAYFTLRLLRAQGEPKVIVYVKHDTERPTLLLIVIENIGRDIAQDVKEMNTLPMARRIPYHSIISDRGRGDTPNSSDGVGPYWSSNLDGAESEKIVPSGHGAEHSPQRIAEVLRILNEHIAGKGTGNRPRPRLRRTEARYDSPSGHVSRNCTILSN